MSTSAILEGSSASQRVVAVTGAGSGIGRACALVLAERGAHPLLVGRRVEPLERTRAAVRERHGVEATVAPADVRRPSEVLSAFERAPGPLRGVVANAGIGGPNGPEDPGGDRFDDLVATNLAGTYHTLRAFERVAVDDGSSRAVVTSSILARIGVPGYTGYCAAKAGLLGLVRAFAMEWAPRGIEVNAVAPGWVDTDMSASVLQTEERAAIERGIPLGRIASAEDLAGPTVFLLSELSRHITGEILNVNGGSVLCG